MPDEENSPEEKQNESPDSDNLQMISVGISEDADMAIIDQDGKEIPQKIELPTKKTKKAYCPECRIDLRFNKDVDSWECPTCNKMLTPDQIRLQRAEVLTTSFPKDVDEDEKDVQPKPIAVKKLVSTPEQVIKKKVVAKEEDEALLSNEMPPDPNEPTINIEKLRLMEKPDLIRWLVNLEKGNRVLLRTNKRLKDTIVQNNQIVETMRNTVDNGNLELAGVKNQMAEMARLLLIYDEIMTQYIPDRIKLYFKTYDPEHYLFVINKSGGVINLARTTYPAHKKLVLTQKIQY